MLLRFLRSSAASTGAAELRLKLAADLVTALSFKSGAGIIRTLTVESCSQFLLVLSIISLRFFLGLALKRVNSPPVDGSID